MSAKADKINKNLQEGEAVTAKKAVAKSKKKVFTGMLVSINTAENFFTVATGKGENLKKYDVTLDGYAKSFIKDAKAALKAKTVVEVAGWIENGVVDIEEYDDGSEDEVED